MTFTEALERFLAVWTDDKIRKERLSWRCNESRELAAKHRHPDVLGGSGLTDLQLRTAIHKSFGAPGDFGYGTPEGDSLRKLYES